MDNSTKKNEVPKSSPPKAASEDFDQTQDNSDSNLQNQNTCVETSLPSEMLSSEGLPQQVLRRLRNGETIASIGKINNVIKYGKISFHENSVFFHSLDLFIQPYKSSLIQFNDIKNYFKAENFYAFIKFRTEQNKAKITMMKVLKRKGTNVFLSLCTGEMGLSYKLHYKMRVPESGQSSVDCQHVPYLNVYKSNDDSPVEVGKGEDYFSYKNGEFLLSISRNLPSINYLGIKCTSEDGSFSVVRPLTSRVTEDIIAIIVVDESYHKVFKNAPNIGNRILECGIAINLEN